jgi:hypothetical protein
VLANAQGDQMRQNMAFKQVWSSLSHFKRGFTTKGAHSKDRQDIDLVLHMYATCGLIKF